jgi:hypothetical protein
MNALVLLILSYALEQFSYTKTVMLVSIKHHDNDISRVRPHIWFRISGHKKTKWQKTLAIQINSISHCTSSNKTRNPYSCAANSIHMNSKAGGWRNKKKQFIVFLMPGCLKLNLYSASVLEYFKLKYLRVV